MQIPLIESFLRDLGRSLVTSKVTELRQKAPLDVVTALDHMAEAAATRFLSEHFPGDSLLAEESANSVPYAERIWILDPLDGTVNRASNIPFFAISLALFVHGEPELGFIYDPTHDEMFFARRGHGATLNGAPIHVAEKNVWTLALTSATVQRLAAVAPQALATLLAKHGKLRGLGAQTLQLAYVAAGRIAANVSLETKLWDNAAGALLVQEAGGVYCDLHGRNPFPLQPDAAALRGGTDPCIAATPWMLEAIYPLLEGLRSEAPSMHDDH
jgi:myo-inositol-1(or 4)-monophosphatase